MKKIISILLSILLVVSMLAVIPFSASADTVISVSSAKDLDAMRNNLSGHYKLTKNIDLSGMKWTPIGDKSSAPFKGELDGDGHTISGLTVNMTGLADQSAYVGLFGFLTGDVEDIKFSGVSITVDGAKSVRAGVVAGSNQGKVEGIAATGNIVCKNVTNISSVGGIVGMQTQTATIEECNSGVELKSDGVTIRAGGILGENRGGVVSSCRASGYVEANAKDKAYIGGILGDNQTVTAGTECIGVVCDVLFTGKTYGYAANETYGGGIAGRNDGSLSCAVMEGDLNFDGDSRIYNGQLIGNNTGSTGDLFYKKNSSALPEIGTGTAVTAVAYEKSLSAAEAKPLTDSGNWSLKSGKVSLKGLPALAESSTETTTSMKHQTTTTTKKTTTKKTSKGSTTTVTDPEGNIVTDEPTTTTTTTNGGIAEDSADFGDDDSTPNPKKEESADTFPWKYIVLGVIAVVLAGGVWIILKKKK